MSGIEQGVIGAGTLNFRRTTEIGSARQPLTG